MRYKKNILFLVFFFILIFIKAQFNIPEKPKKIYPIYDFARVLKSNEIIQLNKKLIFFNKKKSIEIVISIIDSINGEDISMVATEWGEKWQIGQKKESNGILILLAIKDNKLSIQTGYGVEPYLTDISCKKIINKIIPYIKKAEYYYAIDNIINNIFQKFKYYNNKKINKKKNFLIEKYYLIIILFILYLFFSKKNKYFLLDESLIIPNISNKENDNNEENNFDGFGEGGHFGGGGASGNW